MILLLGPEHRSSWDDCHKKQCPPTPVYLILWLVLLRNAVHEPLALHLWLIPHYLTHMNLLLLKDVTMVAGVDCSSSLLIKRHYFANKGPSYQGYGFSSSHVWIWELDYKESWMKKNWCLWTVVLEKTFESPFDCKEIQPVHPTGNQPWIFIGRTDVEAETPILWPPDVKNWLIGKYPNAGKDWRQEEKGMTEDEMVGWHHRLNGHEFR